MTSRWQKFFDIADKQWRILSLFFLLAVLAVATATAGHYGITWDEEYRKEYGVVLLNYYSSLGADQEALSKWNLYYYGGFFDLIAQLATKFSPYGVYETRHLVNLLFGFLGIVATCGLASQIVGAMGGFFAALFLTFTPVYYGHMFANPKDIPFAALFALALFCMVRSLKTLPSVPKLHIVQLAVSIGLTMGVRVAGGVLLGCLSLLWGGWFLGRYWTKSALLGQKPLRSLAGMCLSFLVVAVLAWMVMLAFWPWALASPILHPLEALLKATSYDWPLTVFFDGSFIKASELPPSYLPTWFAISLPEFYLVALIAAVALAAAYLLRRIRPADNIDLMLKIGLLLLTTLVPVSMAILLRSTLYDGLRQFLFLIPPVAAVAGVAVTAFLRSNFHLALKSAVAVAIAVSVLLTLVDMAQLHPYQYIYFNRLIAGGLESASTRFETDYYGASYREGVGWLIDNYHPKDGQKVRVANPSRNFLTAHYLQASQELRDRFVPVEAWDDPDIYISITRWNYHLEKEGKVLHVVSRKGVPLLYVVEVQPPS